MLASPRRPVAVRRAGALALAVSLSALCGVVRFRVASPSRAVASLVASVDGGALGGAFGAPQGALEATDGAFGGGGGGGPPAGASPRPHIVFVLMDDLGFDDVGYGSGGDDDAGDADDDDVSTPTIDGLAREGVILTRYYSAFSCTPARGALMTGLSPHRLGLQHGQVFPEQPWGLPSKFAILPQHLKKVGYASHLVGKWHLGHFSAERLPTARGFDSFFGGLDGAQYYATHIDAMDCKLPGDVLYAGFAVDDFEELKRKTAEHGCYFDLRENNDKVEDLFGSYSTTLFGARAKEVVSEHARRPRPTTKAPRPRTRAPSARDDGGASPNDPASFGGRKEETRGPRGASEPRAVPPRWEPIRAPAAAQVRRGHVERVVPELPEDRSTGEVAARARLGRPRARD